MQWCIYIPSKVTNIVVRYSSKLLSDFLKEHLVFCTHYTFLIELNLTVRFCSYSYLVARSEKTQKHSTTEYMYRVPGFLSSCPKWVPHTLTRERVLLPHSFRSRGETHSLGGGGEVRGPNSDEGTDTLVQYSTNTIILYGVLYSIVSSGQTKPHSAEPQPAKRAKLKVFKTVTTVSWDRRGNDDIHAPLLFKHRLICCCRSQGGSWGRTWRWPAGSWRTGIFKKYIFTLSHT
jgi:hypothetical protein